MPLVMLPGCDASFEEMSFYGAMQAVMDGCPPPGKFKSAGRFVTRPLAGDKIHALTHSLRNAPAAAAPAYRLYALGGAAGRKARCDTAFFFRDAAYIAQIEASWEQDEAGAESAAWVDRHFPYLAGLTAGSWVSFPYSGIKDCMHAYYGGNAARLRHVKRLYDPYGVFRPPQGIRP
jgi:hypothetical protein